MGTHRCWAVSPLALAVWWKRSVILGIFTHCAVNLLGALEMFGQLMR